MKTDKTHRRITAAKYWDEHAIDETAGEEVEIEVQTPLAAILSIRLDPVRYANLKRLAKKRRMPITATVKTILIEALDEPQI